MSKRIYITHNDDVTPEMAATITSIALVNTKPEDRVGIITFKNGYGLCFNEKAKNLSVQIWKEEERK